MNRIYEYRRHLPHYQPSYKAIFLTFSTHQRWTLPPDARTITLESCTWGTGTRFNLHGAVVMPDHVHFLFEPQIKEQDKDGKPVVSYGKYTTIWKKQKDGSWKGVMDMGNSSRSPKA